MDAVITNLIVAAIAGVLGWLAHGWISSPISDVREKRMKALKAAEENAYVGYNASDARIAAARAALNDAVSALRSTSRGQPWPGRLYCRLCRYDLETAAGWLIMLQNMAGVPLPPLGRRN